MKTTYRRVRAYGLAWVVMAAGALALAPLPASAQDVRIREECRCVDRDGNEIENCRCLRSPGVDGILARMLPERSRARMGITVDPNQSAADDSRGARIADVMEDGPAEDAGLREGDIVVSVDGHSLFDPLDRDTEEDFDLDESIPVQRLLALSRSLEPGQEVEVEALRDGELLRVALTARELTGWGDFTFSVPRLRDLGDEPGAWRFRAPEGEGRVEIWRDRDAPEVRLHRFGPEGSGGLLIGGDELFRECPGSGGGERHGNLFLAFGDQCLGGVEMVALKPGLAEYFGTDGGVLVSDVHEESPLGLQPGDVILRIGDREVTSPEHARRILRSYGADEEIALTIMRRNREMSVQGRLGG